MNPIDFFAFAAIGIFILLITLNIGLFKALSGRKDKDETGEKD